MDRGSRESRALVPISGQLQPVPQKSYWSRVGDAYKLFTRAFLIALPLFVVLFIAICPRAFTYDSIFCFFKDLRATASFIPSDYADVHYTYEEGERTVISYRGGVAAVTKGGIEVYSPDGERLLELSEELKAPRAVASRKYLLAYDFGSPEFTVTNAYARLHRGNAGQPVYAAAVADTGQLALVTGSTTYLSQVLVYDSNFNLIQGFGRASATTGVALSNNGKYVAILGLSSVQGDRQTLLELYRIGSKEPVFRTVWEGELPLTLSFTDHRHIAVLTDQALRVVELDGEWKEEMQLNGATPIHYEFSENGCVLIARTSAMEAAYHVSVLDKKGELVYELASVGEDIHAVSLGREQLFLLMDEQQLRISLAEGNTQRLPCERGALDIFAIDDDRLRVVYAGKATHTYFGQERE